MSVSYRSEELEGALRAALRSRAAGDADMLPATIIAALDDIPQRPAWWTRVPSTSRLLLVALVSVALIAGALALATAVRPDRVLSLPGNGLIAFSAAPGRVTRIVDPNTGRVIPRSELRLPVASAGAWSPDGERYAFVDDGGIAIRDVASGVTMAVGDCAAECKLAWAPAGDALAVSYPRRIVVLDLASGASREVVGFDNANDRIWSPTWSPDGERIAFTVGHAIYTVGSDGSDRREVVREDNDRAPLWSVSWSPDGARLAYVASHAPKTDSGWSLAVFLIRPDGSGRTKLADIGSCYCLGWGPPGVTWSPDGEQLAFTTLNLVDTGDASGALFTMPGDGSAEPAMLAQGASGTPSWQPRIDEP